MYTLICARRKLVLMRVKSDKIMLVRIVKNPRMSSIRESSIKIPLFESHKDARRARVYLFPFEDSCSDNYLQFSV